MKTKATEALPEIEWERKDLMEVHDHEKHYNAKGTADSGIEYTGIWIETDGEFVEIVDIEES